MMLVNLALIGLNVLVRGDLMYQRKTKGFGMMRLKNTIVEVLTNVIPHLRYSSNGFIAY